MEKAIVIDGLKKYYGEKAAVDGISFEVEQGTLFSLLGVNGAGKTTTIKLLTGLVKPDCGDAYVMGRSIKDELDKVKKIVSVSPQPLHRTLLSGRILSLLPVSMVWGGKRQDKKPMR